MIDPLISGYPLYIPLKKPHQFHHSTLHSAWLLPNFANPWDILGLKRRPLWKALPSWSSLGPLEFLVLQICLQAMLISRKRCLAQIRSLSNVQQPWLVERPLTSLVFFCVFFKRCTVQTSEPKFRHDCGF